VETVAYVCTISVRPSFSASMTYQRLGILRFIMRIQYLRYFRKWSESGVSWKSTGWQSCFIL